MTPQDISKMETQFTKELLQHTLLFSRNKESFGPPLDNGVNTFLIFGGILEELDLPNSQVKILNIKTKNSTWYNTSEICIEEDLGKQTEEELLQMLAAAQ